MKRIYRNAVWIWILLMAGGGLIFGWKTALSIALGGLLGLVNFRWTESLVDEVLRADGQADTRRTVVKFLGRLVLILLGLFAIIHTSFLSVSGVVAGLSIFVLSGMLEALLILFENKTG